MVMLAFASIYFLWGGTFMAASIGLEGFPAFILSGLRFCSAGFILIILRILKGERLYFKSMLLNAIPGILMLGIGTGFVSWSQLYVSSSEASIMEATVPFLFIALDKKHWHYYFSDRRMILGLIIGFLGLILFVSGSMMNMSAMKSYPFLRPLAFVVLILAGVCWVEGSLFSRRHPSNGSIVMLTGHQLLMGGIFCLVLSAFKGEWHGFSFRNVPFSCWISLSYLSVLGSVVSYLAYIWLLGVKSPALVSTYTYVNPVVAVFINWLFTRQLVSVLQIIALCIILSAVLLTNFSSYKISFWLKPIKPFWRVKKAKPGKLYGYDRKRIKQSDWLRN